MVPVRRHARHWRTYLAGGGLVLGFLALLKPMRSRGTDPSQNDHGSADGAKTNRSKEQGQEWKWLASAHELAGRFVEQHERHHAEGQSESNTNKRIAIGALAIAAISAAVSSITLIVVSSQTGAAWRANAINQNILAGSISSSVYFENTFHIRDVTYSSGLPQPSVLFRIGNSGASTTRRLTYQSTCRSSLSRLADPYDDAALTAKLAYHAALPPKGFVTPIACTLDPSTLSQFILEKRWLYVFGVARYQDTVDAKTWHRVEFCLEAHGTGANGLGLNTIQQECGQHNCTDDECSE